MKNAWTGGQYSIVRAIFGAYLFGYFVGRVDVSTPVAILAAVTSIFFAIGWFDRIAAIPLWCALAWLHGRDPLALQSTLLLIHAALPPAPFLSIGARGRVDPRGNWSFPPRLFAVAWIVTSLSYGWSGWTIGLGLHLIYAPLALFRPVRPWLWLALLVAHLGLLDVNLMLVGLHLFIFDPAWVPRRAPDTTDEVFYDGSCGLCHSGMRWLVAEDPTGTSFRYAPLGGDAFAAAFPDTANLPDSVIVKTESGAVLVRSDAAVHLLSRLGGIWRIGGLLYGALPRRLRDTMYDFVARVRYRVFGRAKDACPLMPPDLRSRFTV